MKRNTLLLLLAFWLANSFVYGQNPKTERKSYYRPEVTAQKGMAATSHPLATQVAIDILKLGGSAVDAAIAANAVLGVVNPMICGIGGNLSAMVWDAKTNQLKGLNAAGTAPAALNAEYFRKSKSKEIPKSGALPLAIPGCISAWEALHKSLGRLSLEEIFQPAIAYAEEGFPLSEDVAEQWKRQSAALKNQPGFETLFMPKGAAPEKGDLFQNRELAQTYRRIAEAGLRSFYEGEIANEIVRYADSCGAVFHADDLAAYRSEWVKPISTSYHGHEIWQMPLNSQGFMVLEILNLLEAGNFTAGLDKSNAIHQLVEVQKMANNDAHKLFRNEAGINVEKLIDKAFAGERARQLQGEKAGKSPSLLFPHDEIMAFITIADKEGNMVALVQGSEWSSSSNLSISTLGFMLQSNIEGYSLHGGRPNTISSERYPSSALLPTIVTKDGQPLLSMCFSDVNLQVQGQLQMIINLIDNDMPLRAAADAISFLYEAPEKTQSDTQNETGWLRFEAGTNYEVIRGLMKSGHRIRFGNIGKGGMGAILRKPATGVYYGITALGKDGQVAGY